MRSGEGEQRLVGEPEKGAGEVAMVKSGGKQ